MDLAREFDSFKVSPEATKPVFLVREDWREWQEEQAYLNGDLASDSSPNTQYESDWAEPIFIEPTDEELQGLEVVTKISRKTKKLGFDGKEPEEGPIIETI